MCPSLEVSLLNAVVRAWWAWISLDNCSILGFFRFRSLTLCHHASDEMYSFNSGGNQSQWLYEKIVYEKNFFYFTKTTLHDSSSKELDCNYGLGAHFAGFVHKSPDNVLLSHTFSDSFCRAMDGISLGNVCHMIRTCTQCDPSPTHSSVFHSLLFLFLTLAWSIGLCVPFQLCFLYRWSSVRRRRT